MLQQPNAQGKSLSMPRELHCKSFCMSYTGICGCQQEEAVLKHVAGKQHAKIRKPHVAVFQQTAIHADISRWS